jgi:outer membrane lipoprotein-sorting protein
MAAWLCVLMLFLFPLPDNREAAELGSRVETRYRSAKTLQATFLERYAENGNLLRSDAGTAYFRRPGKMRWEYVRPEKDLFLAKMAWSLAKRRGKADPIGSTVVS